MGRADQKTLLHSFYMEVIFFGQYARTNFIVNVKMPLIFMIHMCKVLLGNKTVIPWLSGE